MFQNGRGIVLSELTIRFIDLKEKFRSLAVSWSVWKWKHFASNPFQVESLNVADIDNSLAKL